MSGAELDRVAVVADVLSGRLSQKDGARQLGITPRQFRRLQRRFLEDGPAGLASRRRGRPSNRRLADAVREAAVRLARDRYAGFNLTHLHEMLTSREGLILSRETLRKLCTEAGIHTPKARRRKRAHPGRLRRPQRGELVQIDGSDHDWFEGRGPRCTLIVFIDDATGELAALRFVPAETTRAYLRTLRDYLSRHGRPAALYSDRHSIFRNSLPGHEADLTQFARVLKTLDIEGIQAYTPQAKGRVERVNQTLQDRLISEMRLEQISNIDAGNAFLEGFKGRFNERFAQTPRSERDAHRPVLHDEQALSQILAIHTERTISKDLVVRFDNARLQIDAPAEHRRLQRQKVIVCEPLEGPIILLKDGRSLSYRTLEVGEPPMRLADEKSIHNQVEDALANQKRRGPTKPRPDHPWKQPGRKLREALQA